MQPININFKNIDPTPDFASLARRELESILIKCPLDAHIDLSFNKCANVCKANFDLISFSLQIHLEITGQDLPEVIEQINDNALYEIEKWNQHRSVI